MKGYTLGGAQISPVHANFVVNTGQATGNDIRELLRDVENRVLEARGITLEREVRLLD
jgi:UDP-N-acetylmuramate dehydrogenase